MVGQTVKIMKIILIDVSSLDGKLTKWKGNDIYEWSSREDFMHFQKVKSENNLIVMGSGTFDKVKDIENAGLKPEKERLRIIMTRRLDKYQKYSIPGQMEFSNESPHDLVHRLEQQGYKQMLLVSGGKVATSFFIEQLIDELWLTIEPKIFGSGEPLVQEGAFDINLRLLDIQKLNNNGTLLLKYHVLKS
jgi:dihydrofolate reductase